MKWLVARYPQPPGTLIKLGAVLTDPENPESSLNRKTGIVPIDDADKLDQSVAVQRQLHAELSSTDSALLKVVPPTSPLYNAGISVGARSSKEVQTNVEAMNVKAVVFLPDKAYMDKVLLKPEITSYVKEGMWAKRLYVIVGVATAGELSISEEQAGQKNISAGANASAGGATLAAEASTATESSASSSVQVKEPCDFAYRIKEFVYSKFLRPELKDKGDYTEGPLFRPGEDEDGPAEESDDAAVPDFDGWIDAADDNLLGFVVEQQTAR